ELQEALPTDTTVVEYFFARDEIVAFVISRSRFGVVRHVTPAKRVQFLTGRLQYQMERFAALFPNKEADVIVRRPGADQLMNHFYRELVLPIMPLMETSGLIIVPHGVLHRIPFHAFFDGEHFLTDLFDISYAPSGSVLKYSLERPDVLDDTPLRAVLKPA